MAKEVPHMTAGGTVIKTRRKTWVQKPDGTTETIPATVQDIGRLQDKAVSDALADLGKYGTLEPLLFQLEQANPAIFRNTRAVEVIAQAARRKSVKGRGRKTTPEKQEQEYRIRRAIHRLQALGLPVSGDIDKDTACGLIAARVHLSPEQVFTIWNQRDRGELASHLDTFGHDFGLDLMMQTLGRKPEPLDILRHYFPTKQEAAQDEARADAAAHSLLMDWASRVFEAAKRSQANRWGLRFNKSGDISN